MLNKRTIILAALVAAIGGCGGGDAPVEVPMRRIDPIAAFPAGNYVIRTDAQWQELWDRRLAPAWDPQAVKPVIDFSQEALLAISDGWGGCETFRIVRVVRYGDDLVVEGEETPPPPNASCAAVLSPKRDFVLVPASIKGRVDFVLTRS